MPPARADPVDPTGSKEVELDFAVDIEDFDLGIDPNEMFECPFCQYYHEAWQFSFDDAEEIVTCPSCGGSDVTYAFMTPLEVLSD